MGPSPSARLLGAAGDAAGASDGPFALQALAWLVLFTGALGLLHLILSGIRRRLPLALFCLLGGLASVAAGLGVLWPTLVEQGRRSLTSALLWWPGFALGFFVVGVAGAAAWTVLTAGLARWIRRRAT